MNNRVSTQCVGGYNSSSSSSGTSQSTSTSQEGSRAKVPHHPPQKEHRPHPQLADIQGTTASLEVGQTPWHLIRTISSPEILRRFLTVDSHNDPLRYEADIGILEGRVCERDDMLSRRIIEEGWEEVDAVDESISLYLEVLSEEDGSFQGMRAPQIYSEAYSDSYSG